MDEGHVNSARRMEHGASEFLRPWLTKDEGKCWKACLRTRVFCGDYPTAPHRLTCLSHRRTAAAVAARAGLAGRT